MNKQKIEAILKEKLTKVFKQIKEVTYQGEPLEKGGTSIAGKAVKYITTDFPKMLNEDDVILDYGAGKYARNADFLRENGYKVFAYDPFNGSDVDGWEIGNVSSTLPDGVTFDFGFSSYVLNVVPESVEDSIISELDKLCNKQVHLTRNRDIIDLIKKSAVKDGNVVNEFYINQFAPKYEGAMEDLEDGQLEKETILAFAKFGTATSRGFQRIPFLEEKGFELVKNTSGQKVYVK